MKSLLQKITAVIFILNAIISIITKWKEINMPSNEALLNFSLLATMIVSGSAWVYLAWQNYKTTKNNEITDQKAAYDKELNELKAKITEQKTDYDQKFLAYEKENSVKLHGHISNSQGAYSDLLAGFTQLRQSIEALLAQLPKR